MMMQKLALKIVILIKITNLKKKTNLAEHFQCVFLRKSNEDFSINVLIEKNSSIPEFS